MNYSASQMSAMIRAKKKKMEDDPDVVKLSGHHMDATDIDIMKLEEATDSLDENHPKERDEDPSLSSLHADEVAAQPHDESAPDPKEVNEDGEKMKRMVKLKASMMKARK